MFFVETLLASTWIAQGQSDSVAHRGSIALVVANSRTICLAAYRDQFVLRSLAPTWSQNSGRGCGARTGFGQIQTKALSRPSAFVFCHAVSALPSSSPPRSPRNLGDQCVDVSTPKRQH